MAKYSKGAGKKVEKVMHEKKQGQLKSGRSGKKVTSRKQAIAIGLSEAREAGEKVPKKRSASKTAGKTASKKSVTKELARKQAANVQPGEVQTAAEVLLLAVAVRPKPFLKVPAADAVLRGIKAPLQEAWPLQVKAQEKE
jgi:hypothetical protein